MKKVLVFLLFGLCVGVVFLELLLRFDGRSSQTHRWMADLAIAQEDGSLRGSGAVRGWFAAEEHEVFVDLDEEGRRRVAPGAVGPLERRVVLLGGPSVWGVGVGQDELLSSWLAAELPAGNRVENRAQPARGLDRLRRGLEGVATDPDEATTVLAFVGAADLAPATAWRGDPAGGIEEWSFAARFLHERWLRLFGDAEVQRSEEALRGREEIDAEIFAMQEVARARGIRLALVYAPDGWLSDSLQDEARDEIAAIAAERGIAFMDLLGLLADFERPSRPLLAPRFGTWTPQAHFRVARLLLDSNFLSGPVKDYEVVPGGQWVEPDHPYLGYTGRLDRTNPNRLRFDWAGVAVRMRMRGDSARIFLRAERQHDYFDVRIDGKPSRVWIPGPKGRDLRLDDLGEGVHEIEIIKRTDGITPIVFDGIWLPPGAELLPVDPPPTRRILVLGASWAHGYGNEGTLYGHENGGGTQRDCADSRRLSNVALSWPWILGDRLGAEVHLVTKGAAGVVRNYEDAQRLSGEPLPARVGRTLSSDPDSQWNASDWVPDLVVINLGENDFTQGPTPSEAEFVEGYRALLSSLREAYPEALIVAYNLESGETVRRLVGEALGLERAEGDRKLGSLSYRRLPRAERGCQNHPSVAMHRRMAAELADYVLRQTWTTISWPEPAAAEPRGGP